MDTKCFAPFERKNTRFKIEINQSELNYGRNSKNNDFTCRNCGRFVSADIRLAGVHNRNHCPYCLSSKHVDLWSAGDRLSACKAVMHPVGLTIKRTHKKYASLGDGEMMLVHRCSDCSKISINRIAADDDESRITMVYRESFHMEIKEVEELKNLDIQLITSLDEGFWRTVYFGCQDI